MQSPRREPRRIVITGCSGFVGRELVPLLDAHAEILLVGRDPQQLMSQFPGRRVCDYAALAQEGRGYDLLLHLAVVNNDSGATEAQFDAVNVDLAVRVAEIARAAGIPEMVHVSSFHALDPAKTDGYARSKRLASDKLRQLDGIRIVELFLPAVYGRSWGGILRSLNGLPRWISGLIFRLLAAFRPTVCVSKVAELLTSSEGVGEGDQILLADDQDANPVYRVAMRAIDLGFALAVALFMNWLLLVCWVMIRLEGAGPGIFVQPRVGRAGKIFACYKFRTMAQGTVQAASHEVSVASVTRTGHFLRRTKIDELPQILNIFRNEISLVGPRPCLPIQQELVGERSRRGVLTMKPGITGYAQINDVDMSDPPRLAEMDARYKALRSIPFNLSIIVATITGRGQGDKTRPAGEGTASDENHKAAASSPLA